MPDGRGSHPNSKRGYARAASWVKAGLFESGERLPEYRHDKRGQTSRQRCSHAVVTGDGRYCLICDAEMDEGWREAWLGTSHHAGSRPAPRTTEHPQREVA